QLWHNLTITVWMCKSRSGAIAPFLRAVWSSIRVRTLSTQAAMPQQGLGTRLPSTKAFENFHGMFRAAHGEDCIAVATPHGGNLRFIVESGFLKGREGIGTEYLGPFVAVVTRRIAAGKDVAK